ncbi:MAG: hypothetical protein KDM63_07640 [Verrucomicrobiae bacterium]|nr:hypothetical protein [Verrucomicrobiae bacterium]
METKLQLKERQRVERLKAKIPPISPIAMPFIILIGGVILAKGLFALGADYIYVWPTFAVFGFAIFSFNAYTVRRRIERLDEEHLLERKMLDGALRAEKEGRSSSKSPRN